MAKKQSRSLLMLAAFGAVTAGAAWYGAHYSRGGSRDPWYRELNKPGFTPPEKMIPVVWTTLYALIAWSGWRVWSAAPSRQRSAALRLWVSQLAANAKWSKLFFGEHRPDLSLADSIALEGTIASYISNARHVDRAAANAFIPYAAWVAYATVLNAEIVRLNPRRTEELPRPA
ncbi:MAG: TspO/MBR family protein [Candidatus Sulfotelmatobacter sp.]